ncbi:MAG: MarR family transcriptional regulator [Anaerolineaceae bacterium]|jgi:DNA-binding MarR family transcriptional regulator|nr:MarR family transcriptional regulator [Anaerolineaceae bacterium]MDD4042817.1 MarR family transcriptional regulator [Anaerolineaceae bacterium]MDD4577947.1 MarR family transcriptional regulator [Anaerolineaceae bacterium]
MNDTFLKFLYDLADLIARNSMIERFHFIQDSGISQSQMISMFYLHRNQNVAINALACYLGISNPAVSQLIDKLVRSGLVKRIDNPDDRRGKLLGLTEEGKSLVTRAKIAHHQWVQTLAESIQPEERPVIEEAIQIILKKHALLQGTEHQSPTRGEN